MVLHYTGLIIMVRLERHISAIFRIQDLMDKSTITLWYQTSTLIVVGHLIRILIQPWAFSSICTIIIIIQPIRFIQSPANQIRMFRRDRKKGKKRKEDTEKNIEDRKGVKIRQKKKKRKKKLNIKNSDVSQRIKAYKIKVYQQINYQTVGLVICIININLCIFA